MDLGNKSKANTFWKGQASGTRVVLPAETGPFRDPQATPAAKMIISSKSTTPYQHLHQIPGAIKDCLFGQAEVKYLLVNSSRWK